MPYSPHFSRPRTTHATHEERLVAIDAMDHAALVAFVAEKAKIQDVAWLRSLLQDGAFDVPQGLHLGSNDSKQNGLYSAPGVSLINALANVVQGAQTVNLAGEVTPAFLPVTDEFRIFFAETVQRASNGFEQALREAVTNGKPWSSLERMEARASWDATQRVLLTAACALDDGDSVRLLATLGASSAWPDVRWLGDAHWSLKRSPHALDSKGNAVLAAVIFSSHHALDALRKAGCDEGPMVVYSAMEKTPKKKDPRFPLDKNGSPDLYTGLLGHLLEHGLTAKASMVSRAVNDTKVDGAFFNDKDRELFYVATMDAIASDRPVDHEKLKGLLMAGACDYNPAGALKSALIHQRREVLDHFSGREPWEELFPPLGDSVLSEVMRVCASPLKAQACAPLLTKLMNDAEAAGFGDRLYRPGVVSRDVELAIQHGHPSVLLAHLDHGLKANTVFDDGETPLSLAEIWNNDAAINMMHAHAARSTAHGLLHDLGVSSFVAKATS